MIDKKTQGKKNRDAGARFELKVRKSLEADGWVVDKWSNNVEFKEVENKFVDLLEGRIVPAKRKYNGPGRPMSIGTGFPDFVAFRWGVDGCKGYGDIIGVEVKSNGYLDPKEREKCKWLLENNKFSKILIASKSKKRGEIIYESHESRYGAKANHRRHIPGK